MSCIVLVLFSKMAPPHLLNFWTTRAVLAQKTAQSHLTFSSRLHSQRDLRWGSGPIRPAVPKVGRNWFLSEFHQSIQMSPASACSQSWETTPYKQLSFSGVDFFQGTTGRYSACLSGWQKFWSRTCTCSQTHTQISQSIRECMHALQCNRWAFRLEKRQRRRPPCRDCQFALSTSACKCSWYLFVQHQCHTFLTVGCVCACACVCVRVFVHVCMVALSCLWRRWILQVCIFFVSISRKCHLPHVRLPFSKFLSVLQQKTETARTYHTCFRRRVPAGSSINKTCSQKRKWVSHCLIVLVSSEACGLSPISLTWEYLGGALSLLWLTW